MFRQAISPSLVYVISEISRETLQSLLELLCFYNCEDSLNEKWIEERWFRSGHKKMENKKTWKYVSLYGYINYAFQILFSNFFFFGF